MTNTNIAATVDVLPKCGKCGQPGAKWVLRANGKSLPVHKPCGNLVAACLPEGTVHKIVPSNSLRAEWAKRDAEAAAQFFARDTSNSLLKDKLAGALKAPKSSASKHLNGTGNAATSAQPDQSG